MDEQEERIFNLEYALNDCIQELKKWREDQGKYGTKGYDEWIPLLEALHRGENNYVSRSSSNTNEGRSIEELIFRVLDEKVGYLKCETCKYRSRLSDDALVCGNLHWEEVKPDFFCKDYREGDSYYDY